MLGRLVLPVALLVGAVTACDVAGTDRESLPGRGDPAAPASASPSVSGPATAGPDVTDVCIRAADRLAPGSAVLSAARTPLSSDARAAWPGGNAPAVVVTCLYTRATPQAVTPAPGCSGSGAAVVFPTVEFQVDPGTGRAREMPADPAADPCAG